MSNFFIEIKSEVNSRVANNEFFNHEEAFSSIISFYLHQAGVIEGFNECYVNKEIKGINVKINGFYFSDDQKNLDLFISYWNSDYGSLSINRLERKQLLKQEKFVKNFLEIISSIQLRTLEETSTFFEFASEYKTAKKKLEKQDKPCKTVENQGVGQPEDPQERDPWGIWGWKPGLGISWGI